jgi:hypothetical protein
LIKVVGIGQNIIVEVDTMYSSIFETVLKGSNKVFLGIPEEDYFLTYENLDKESAQDLVINYFKYTGRDGIPEVKEIEKDPTTHRIVISIDVDHNRDTKLEPASTPHYLGAWREH